MDKLDGIVYRFMDLQRRHGHAKRRPEDQPFYDQAQREMWLLGQAICTLTHPDIQAELDDARRDVAAQIRLHIEHATPVVVHPRRRQRPLTWSDFQLTPELSIDPTTTGACVTMEVAKRLQRAHKAQVSAIMSVVHRYR